MAVACALVVLSGVAGARAAAPMCDPQAQTIAAPVPLMPLKNGKLGIVRCASDLIERFGAIPAAPERQPEFKLDLGQRVAPVLSRLVIDAPLAALAAVMNTDAYPGSGFRYGIYRPPRAVNPS
jgi:hypothetical protein